MVITGTLVMQDYEINSTNKGTVYMIILDAPTVLILDDEELGYETQPVSLSKVQVAMNGGESKYIGQHITLEGKVLYAHTGHHLTPILLVDAKLKNS